MLVPQKARVVLWMSLLGLGSGFPLLFSSQIFKAWLLDKGASIHAIGGVSILTAPYILSFLWAPFFDYAVQRGYVSRRYLISVLFMLTGLCLYVFSTLDPKQTYYYALTLGLILAVVSSTQDRLIDAYRVTILPKALQALGVTSSMFFFRLAVMLAGGGCLIFSGTWGWSRVYELSALLMVLLSGLFLLGPIDKSEVRGDSLRLHLAQCVAVFKACVRDRSFFIFLLSYRLSIFWLEAMMPVFLGQYMGMSMYMIGWLYKVYGMFGLLVGSLLMGGLMQSYSIKRLFYLCLVLQALLGVGFYLSTIFTSSYAVVGILVLGECFIQGMLGTLSLYWLSGQLQGQGSAFSFALWNGLGSIGRVFVGPIAAYVIDTFGWASYMQISIVIAILALHICTVHFGSETTELA